MFEETIAAVSTPPGEGGISVVRISGPKAFTIADRIFEGEIRPSKSPSHRILYGKIRAPESRELVDEVLLLILRAPKTYTTEDMVEINCHGGFLVTREILETVLRSGARLAEPGEFTKRAFLNGRIDLTQAEAVLDVIRSRTTTGLRISIEQLGGKLLSEMNDLRQQLIEVFTLLEASVDFSESDSLVVQRDQLQTSLEGILRRVEALFQTCDAGRILRDGAKLAIVGKQNVGKSSLLNALLEEDRAIVSSVPGTTRDTIEEWLNIEGFSLQIMDTAGIGAPAGIVEKEGARRAEERMGQADLVLFMVDGSAPLEEMDISLARRLNGKKHVLVINKIDLRQQIDKEQLAKLSEGPIIEISALHGHGLGELKRCIIEGILKGHSIPKDGTVVSHVRHRDILARTRVALKRTLGTLEGGLSEEFVALDVREALNCIGEITGETAPEEILKRIFSEFCIGK